MHSSLVLLLCLSYGSYSLCYYHAFCCYSYSHVESSSLIVIEWIPCLSNASCGSHVLFFYWLCIVSLVSSILLLRCLYDCVFWYHAVYSFIGFYWTVLSAKFGFWRIWSSLYWKIVSIIESWNVIYATVILILDLGYTCDYELLLWMIDVILSLSVFLSLVCMMIHCRLFHSCCRFWLIIAVDVSVLEFWWLLSLLMCSILVSVLFLRDVLIEMLYLVYSLRMCLYLGVINVLFF